jgi:hypothetical protein
MEKPINLYHASPQKDVSEFEPRNESPRYTGEENLVFATPHKEVAAMFLVPKDIPTEIGKYGDDHVVFVNGTAEEFKAHDIGGAIYTLPNDTFVTDRGIGMGDVEWVSNQSVKPISKTLYETSIDALHDNHVSVYFLNKDVFSRIQANPSNGLEIVKSSKLVH